MQGRRLQKLSSIWWNWWFCWRYAWDK